MATGGKHIYSKPNPLEVIEGLVPKLELLESSKLSFQTLVGFDGFVDKIQKEVKNKQGNKNIFFKTIEDFSKHLGELGGKSGQVEIVTTKEKFGGNAPILANTFATLGIKSLCLGALGFPDIDPILNQVKPEVEKISLNSPGQSQALEFEDGKIIFSELGSFSKYNWLDVGQKVNIKKLQKKVKRFNLFALVDWANIQNATDIWQGFLDDIIKPSGRSNRLFFFDLCDPSKKSPQEIDEVIDLISDYSNYGKVTLGMNENEAIKTWIALNGKNESKALPSLNEIGKSLYRTMTIDTLLIHPLDRSLTFQNNQEIEIDGRWVTNPAVLTGGGDNLNAGYSLGMLLDLPVPKCMLLGMAASGSFIQNGKSSSVKDLIEYIELWEMESKLSLKSGSQVQSKLNIHS